MTIPRRFLLLMISLLILLITDFIVINSTNLNAQDLDNATISGRVADENGAIIQGATITVINKSTGTKRMVVTNAEGSYRVIGLPPGIYNVSATAAGFAESVQQNLAANSAQNVRSVFTLKPAELVAEQVVTSEAEMPPIDTTRTIVGGTIDRDQIESLPINSRAPLDLVLTFGGVTEEPLSTRDLAVDRGTSARGGKSQFFQSTPEEAGSFGLSGGAAFSNNITIDGLDNNDDRGARERFQPSLEAIDEVQVISNQFSAEYGRASGGRVNIRTRGGANRYHGRLFYFFRDEALNANTWRNNLIGLSRLPVQENNPGLTLSGPVYLPSFGKDSPAIYDGHKRTFFFIAYEYDNTFDSALIDTLVPVEANPIFPLVAPTTLEGARLEQNGSFSRTIIAPFIDSVTTPLRNNIGTARLDHNFTNTHNVTFTYQFGRSLNLRQFGGGNALADALIGRVRNSDTQSVSDNYVFSSHAVNQARFQYSRLTPAVSSAGERPVVAIAIRDPLPTSNPLRQTGSLVAGSSTLGASDRSEERLQFQDTVSFLFGRHSFKFGSDIGRIDSTFSSLEDSGGTFNFDSAGQFLAGTILRYRQNFLTTSTLRNTYSGIFVQDEIKLRSNLTLSLGVRYENETVLRDLNNVGPRVGVAYDPFGTGKTVIRAGYGIFYNRALLRTLDDFALGKQTLIFDTDTLRDPVTGRLLTSTQRAQFIAANLTFPNRLTVDSPIVEQNAIRENNFSRILDPNLRIPESYQANVGFERELTHNLVFEANYTFNRGAHLWREFNPNAPRVPAGFANLTQYLLSTSFNNTAINGVRPIYGGSSPVPRNTVQFTLSQPASNPIFNVGQTTFINLNALNSGTNSTNTLNAAFNTVNLLRPDPTRGQLEQLVSLGNSFYHGLQLELRSRVHRTGSGFATSFRAVYTLSKLMDDGIVNTSDALRNGDFNGERSRSLLDRRHQFALSGTFDMPRWFGSLRFSPILRVASGAPFNIGIGDDRNLDDIPNDRPIFTGDLDLLRSREPDGAPIDSAILNAFALTTIGQTGNLPRNAGIGPSLFLFDLNVVREFHIGERIRLRPTLEFDNVLNKRVFSFGAEFIDFESTDGFLIPTRTRRPRELRVGIRIDF